MKFMISYECKNGEGSFSGSFIFEAERKPEKTDKTVIEAAIKNSTIFHGNGMGGLLITSISLAP